MKKFLVVLAVICLTLIIAAPVLASAPQPPTHPRPRLFAIAQRQHRQQEQRQQNQEHQQDADPWAHPNCGVSGEFGDGGRCPYQPWNNGYYEWFDPQEEFAWLYD